MPPLPKLETMWSKIFFIFFFCHKTGPPGEKKKFENPSYRQLSPLSGLFITTTWRSLIIHKLAVYFWFFIQTNTQLNWQLTAVNPHIGGTKLTTRFRFGIVDWNPAFHLCMVFSSFIYKFNICSPQIIYHAVWFLLIAQFNIKGLAQ